MYEDRVGEKRAISVKAAAELLGVSERTVWRMIADGQLHTVRVRSCTRLAVAEVVGCLGRTNKWGAYDRHAS